MTRTSSTQQSEPAPKSLTQRQTTLVILRVAERAVLAGGTGCGCRRAHPRARTGRAAPSRTALRSVGAASHLLVPHRQPGADGPGLRQDDRLPAAPAAMSALAPTLQSFFTDYLIGQRAASSHTIAAYRDTFRLLVRYVHQRTGIYPSDLDLAVVNAEL